MKPGDEVFWWTRKFGWRTAQLRTGKIKDVDGKYAHVVALDSAPSGFGVLTVALSRLKLRNELPTRKGYE